MSDTLTPNPWQALRRLTPARIALGRAGNGLPTGAALDFALAHARARDAVHAALDATALGTALAALGLASLTVHSAATDRAEYLRRPDLGRRLDAAGIVALDAARAAQAAAPDLLFVIADGLSALAIERHALPTLRATLALLNAPMDGPADAASAAPAGRSEGGASSAGGWAVGPVVIALQARVALGDAIGERLGARQVVVLIGERPGLSSPDGVGIYITHAPRVGRTDAERNCISNVRPQGLAPEAAAATLVWLLREARRLGLTGVKLKDGSASAGIAAAPSPPALA